ncbi:MAG: OmpA family protein [Acidobacteriota bacterium]
MRTFLAALTLFSALPVLAQKPPQDRKGCVDSKVLSRLPGCIINSCRASEYDATEIQVSKTEKKNIEGAFEEISYTCPATASRIQIARNAEAALKTAGFAIPWQADGSNWAGVTGHKEAQWVYVITRNSSYMMRTLKEKALDVTMEANAAGWAQQIEQTGRASIYGITFDTAKATIKPDSEKVLMEMMALFQKNPTWRFAVAGHTDNVGAKQANLLLSRQRAEAVAAWLKAHGVNGDRLLPGGFGDLAPVADNATEDGRAKNRRVDLIKLY